MPGGSAHRFDPCDALLRPFAPGSREELIATAKPFFDEIKQANNITCTSSSPTARCCFACTNLSSSANGLTRTTFEKAKATGQNAPRCSRTWKQALTEPLVRIVSYNGGKYMVAMAPLVDASGVTAGVLFSEREISPLVASMCKGVASNLAILVGSSSYPCSCSTCRSGTACSFSTPSKSTSLRLTWDLSKRLEIKDEIAELANDFNTMTEKLSEMVHQVSNSSTELGRVSVNLVQVYGTVMGAAEQQVSAVNETSTAMTEINTSIKGVAIGVESLSQSTSESSSVLEMAASVEEVAMRPQLSPKRSTRSAPRSTRWQHPSGRGERRPSDGSRAHQLVILRGDG